MKPWLYIGAKVVCVDADNRGFVDHPLASRLVRGETYTIRCVEETHEGLGVWLEEIWTDQKYLDLGEFGFAADRFRPVSTIDTTHQVSLLKKLIEKQPVSA